MGRAKIAEFLVMVLIYQKMDLKIRIAATPVTAESLPCLRLHKPELKGPSRVEATGPAHKSRKSQGK